MVQSYKVNLNEFFIVLITEIVRQSHTPSRKSPQKVFFEEDLQQQQIYLESLASRPKSERPELNHNHIKIDLSSKLELIEEEEKGRGEESKLDSPDKIHPNKLKTIHSNAKGEVEEEDYMSDAAQEEGINKQIYVTPQKFPRKPIPSNQSLSRNTTPKSNKKPDTKTSFHESVIATLKEETVADRDLGLRKKSTKGNELII